MNLEKLETRSSSPSSKKLYTGMAALKIVLVNPSREQIAALYEVDVEKVKEPNYFTDGSTRIDFYYKNHDSVNTPILGKFALFLSNEVRKSQAGKTQYIDNYSKVCWADSLGDLSERNMKLADYSKLKLDTAREALRGEEDLYNLMRAYGNVDTTSSPFVLDSIEKIIKGNVNELREFFAWADSKNGGIKVLLGVKEGQYQDVWTNMFLTVNGKLTDYLRNRITDSQYGYKHYYGNSFTLKEFVASDEPVTTESGSDPWTSEDIEDPFGDSTSVSTSSSSSASSSSTTDVDDLFG
jgi:hypothetical protein